MSNIPLVLGKYIFYVSFFLIWVCAGACSMFEAVEEGPSIEIRDPIESEKVKISAEWLFEKKTLKNKSYNKENVISFACKIMEQDAKACELNQKGIHSIPYENGVLMPEEYVIKNFHDWLRKKLQLENGKGY